MNFCIQLIGYIGYLLLAVLLGGRLGIWLHEVQGSHVRLSFKFRKTSVKYETRIGFYMERDEE